MIIQNPRYYTYEEMKKTFKGYCICVAKLKLKGQRLIGGIVISKDPDMNVVMNDVLVGDCLKQYRDEGTSFENFTELDDISHGIVEVIFHEN